MSSLPSLCSRRVTTRKKCRSRCHPELRQPGISLAPVSQSEARIATHDEPVWRDRTNYIIRVDLAAHGMPGSAEQLWARTDDQRTFELCCVPFFTYGLALGDRVAWDDSSRAATLVERSGRRNVRFAWNDKSQAAEQHEVLHGRLVMAGGLVEFSSSGYGAVDCADDATTAAVIAVLQPLHDAGVLLWEYGDQPADA